MQICGYQSIAGPVILFQFVLMLCGKPCSIESCSLPHAVFFPEFLLKNTFHCTGQEGNVAGCIRSKGHQVGSQQSLYPSLPTRHGSNSSPHPHY